MMLTYRAQSQARVFFVDQSSAIPLVFSDTYTSFCVFEHITVIVAPHVTCTIIDMIPEKILLVRVITYRLAPYVSCDIRLKAFGTITAGLVTRLFLEGSGVHVQMRGALNIGQKSSVTCITEQHHEAPASTSLVNIKGAIHDQARMNYHGSIVVAKHAHVTHARQHNAMLLMGKKARARATPVLQVHANNVHCSHGTAIGHCDEMQVLYLRSRGLPEPRISALLLEAFFTGMV